VGWSKRRDGKRHEVLWQSGRIGQLGRRFRSANAINDSGLIVGACGDNACIGEARRLTDLGKIATLGLRRRHQQPHDRRRRQQRRGHQLLRVGPRNSRTRW
jgi:uncharacterized membrane protein